MKPQPIQPAAKKEENSQLLTKATLQAAKLWKLPQGQLAAILKVSEATVSRWGSGRVIDLESNEGERALYFLRIFRSLDTLLGAERDNAERWLRSENYHLNGVPLELLKTMDGMVHVAEYLDAMRGHS